MKIHMYSVFVCHRLSFFSKDVEVSIIVFVQPRLFGMWERRQH